VSGVIGAASVVAGQVVEAKEILFEVIDPARLAVEALAYDAALAEGIAAASAPLPGNGALEAAVRRRRPATARTGHPLAVPRQVAQ
jgi:hypothetical protein